MCHGDFLNADHEYVHKNRSVKGFGSYGDILIRDRKMYVVPTPFRLIDGVAHHATLVLPDTIEGHDPLVLVGNLSREESSSLVVGYSFDLKTNEIRPSQVPNPNAGKVHKFKAWRLPGGPAADVSMKQIDPAVVAAEEEDE